MTHPKVEEMFHNTVFTLGQRLRRWPQREFSVFPPSTVEAIGDTSHSWSSDFIDFAHGPWQVPPSIQMGPCFPSHPRTVVHCFPHIRYTSNI